jgi:hypothetical protein
MMAAKEMRDVFDRTIPAGSIFDPELYRGQLAPRRLGGGLLPFALYSLFSDLPAQVDLLDRIDGEVIVRGEASLLWLAEDPADRVFPLLPLASHSPLPHTPELREILLAALDRLAAFPPGMALFTEFVRAVALVELRPDARGRDSQITTSSFPVLPFCVFLSERSMRQLPPRSVNPVRSPRFFAENLYHEAIHQALNVHLLLYDVLSPDYNSATAPKVDIYWREEEDFSGDVPMPAGNQQWELDRVLHAVVVYGHLLEYRLEQLADPTLEPFERALFTDATRTGLESVRYLMAAMAEHTDCFTDYGRDVVASLGTAIDAVAARAAEVLPAP